MIGEIFGESQSFTVTVAYEDVYLYGPNVPDDPLIGDFYGDARDAAIDPDEKWCVMVGSGVIVYRLGPPWEPYESSWKSPRSAVEPYSIHERQPSLQWWEPGRGGRDDRDREVPITWLSHIEHVQGDRFEADVTESRNADTDGPTRFAVLANRPAFRPINWLPDVV
jgi:hypothetical protein